MKLIGKDSMTLDDLKQLYDFAQNLSEGKDPISKLKFSKDTILNSKIIIQHNKQIAEMLNDIIRIKERIDQPYDSKRRKFKFYLGEEEKKMVKISKEPISVSSIVYSINGVIGDHMEKLHAVDVTNWLLNQGFLEQRYQENGSKYKAATNLGNEIGITNEIRQNVYGNSYSVNLYNESAQRYLIERINDIIYK